MNKLKIGIDVHGVADADRDFFSKLTRLLVENGHEVHILTGSAHTPALETFLKDELGLRWTHLFSITTHHQAIGTSIDFIDGNPYMDEATWNRTKAEYCQIRDIRLHLDDSPVYGQTFETPYARYSVNRRPEKKRRIAILGGSFNPVTNAHLSVAGAVLEQVPEIHQVWLMPAFHHPFAKHRHYASHRIRMLRMAETPRIRHFGYEIENRLSGETYFTFSRLLSDPDYAHRFSFSMIVGSDCVLDFDRKWKHADELSRTVPFIIVPRPGYRLDGYDGLLSRPPHIRLKSVKIPDISATAVRDRVRRGLPVDHLVPTPVCRFILENGLYRDDPVPEDESDRTRLPTTSGSVVEPSLRVDVAVCTIQDDALKVLLVRMPEGSCIGSWSLPGGPPTSECLETTAAQILTERTGLNRYREQLGTYGGGAGGSTASGTITVVYFALAPFDKIGDDLPKAEERGGDAAWFPLEGIEKAMNALNQSLATGQAKILKDLLTRLRGKISYAPIAFELVPKHFTWPELRRVYEIVLNKSLDATNFKRKIRSVYTIRKLKSHKTNGTKGRPPERLVFEGVRDIYT